MRWRVLASLFLGALLSGCYVSKTPLITPVTADYPVADGTFFNGFVPAGRDWIEKQNRSLHRDGDYYVYRDEGNPEQSRPFLLKRIAENQYVIQVTDGGEYVYQLLNFDGKTAIQYSAICPGRKEWVSRGLLDRIEETATPRCHVSDLRRLALVLTEAAKNAAPEGKYVVASQ